MVYPWVGGVSYILLVLATFAVALRTVFVTTPWQPYLIVSLATFVGEALEGFIIDTGRWRHFFLILVSAAATYRYRRQRQGWHPGNMVAHPGAG